MVAEGRKLGCVGRAVARATRQHVKPYRHTSIPSRQGKQLQLLQPLPRRVVARLQARYPGITWLVRKETRKGHAHAVRMESIQVETMVRSRFGDQIAPDTRRL